MNDNIQRPNPASIPDRTPVKTQNLENLTEEVTLDSDNQDVLSRVEEIEEEETEEEIDDDDNAYQDSDDALPDDAEEAAISRDPSRESGLFDEI